MKRTQVGGGSRGCSSKSHASESAARYITPPGNTSKRTDCASAEEVIFLFFSLHFGKRQKGRIFFNFRTAGCLAIRLDGE